MRIAERVWLVGSGRMGFEASHALDCNVYLLDGGAELALIDAGSGLEPERIVANIERAGVPLDRVRHLLLTHAHGDHAAGARFLRDRLGLGVTCPRESVPWLESGDLEATSVRAAMGTGLYPGDFRYEPCPVASPVADGDEVAVGDLRLRVIETPGHSRGHAGYLWTEDGGTALFGGDAVFAGGRVLIQNIWDCSLQEYARTVRRLDDLSLDRLYPGHGPVLLSEAREHVRLAHLKFENLGVPPNLM